MFNRDPQEHMIVRLLWYLICNWMVIQSWLSGSTMWCVSKSGETSPICEDSWKHTRTIQNWHENWASSIRHGQLRNHMTAQPAKTAMTLPNKILLTIVNSSSMNVHPCPFHVILLLHIEICPGQVLWHLIVWMIITTSAWQYGVDKKIYVLKLDAQAEQADLHPNHYSTICCYIFDKSPHMLHCQMRMMRQDMWWGCAP